MARAPPAVAQQHNNSLALAQVTETQERQTSQSSVGLKSNTTLADPDSEFVQVRPQVLESWLVGVEPTVGGLGWELVISTVGELKLKVVNPTVGWLQSLLSFLFSFLLLLLLLLLLLFSSLCLPFCLFLFFPFFPFLSLCLGFWGLKSGV